MLALRTSSATFSALRFVAPLTVVLLTACAGQGAPGASAAASPPSTTDAPSAAAQATDSPRPSANFPVAGDFTETVVAGLRAEADVPFTDVTRCDFDKVCTVPLDILAPEAGDGHPTIVLVPGGPVPFHERRYLEPLAIALAQRDAVVFITSYRNPETDNGEVDSFHDVRCAVRYAREHTAEYGGDPNRVVLVGKSHGSYLALRVAILPDEEPVDCLSGGSSIPDAVVGLAGFGIRTRDAAETAPPIWLVGGSEDTGSASGPIDERLLRERGFDATYIEIEGIDHAEMHDPVINPDVVDIIMDAAASMKS